MICGTGCRKAAEPVKTHAERLTLAKIGLGRVPWYQMRIGVTQAGVYIVPKQRGRTGNPNRKRRSYRTTVLPRMLDGGQGERGPGQARG